MALVPAVTLSQGEIHTQTLGFFALAVLSSVVPNLFCPSCPHQPVALL